jgi:ribosome biogenesis GTPase
MHFLDDPEGGAIIDTPGIRDLGVVDLEAREIGHYFVEFRPLLNQCRFHNCRHLNEPGCAVLQAVEDGTVSAERYYNYLSILHNEDIYR